MNINLTGADVRWWISRATPYTAPQRVRDALDNKVDEKVLAELAEYVVVLGAELLKLRYVVKKAQETLEDNP
jgi:hypothetical protein